MKKMLTPLMIIAISSTNSTMCSFFFSKPNNIFDAIGKNDRKAVERLTENNALLVHELDFFEMTPLHRASQEGKESIIKLLLDKRANIEATDSGGRTPLHEASEYGKESIVKLLVGNGANIEARDNYGNTSLHRASWRGHKSIVRLLLFMGANIGAPDDEGRTPLHRASQEGKESIIKLLLDKRANIEATDSGGRTPLHRASWGVRKSIVKLLLSIGANIEAIDRGGRTPLHAATSSVLDNEPSIELLLDGRANIEAHDENGSTPLLVAASGNRNEACEQLICKNACIGKKDTDGNTALHIAILGTESFRKIVSEEINSSHIVSYEREKVLRLFLKNGLNIDEKNNGGDTPLHIATKRSDSRSCRLLIQKKANIDARDSNMRSAIHLAALNDDPYIVDILLTYRPSVDLRDGFGCEPLHYGCLTRKCFAAFKSLPNYSLKTNLSGWNPLHVACSTNNKIAVERLLRQGVDVNRQIGKTGKTALMIACQNGCKEICIFLLSDGALDKDARDNDLGGTALDWACEFEHLEICELLLDKGFTYKTLYEKFKLLRRACRNDHVDLCEVILDVFSLWDKVDEKGNSVLHYACTYGSKDVVEFVLRKHKDKGLQVCSKNSGGKLAFHLAEENNLTDIVKLLTMYGVRPPEEKNKGGS